MQALVAQRTNHSNDLLAMLEIAFDDSLDGVNTQTRHNAGKEVKCIYDAAPERDNENNMEG